ncbi:MAG: hypothetical protein ABDH21_06120 [bacterium]
MSKKDLINMSIRKAIEEGNLEFLESLIDLISVEQILDDQELQDEIVQCFYEYCMQNYDKAKELANISYLRGYMKAKILLDMIECNNLFNTPLDENKLVSFIIRNSDDLFISAFAIFKYIKYLDSMNIKDVDIAVVKFLNGLIELYPQPNLKILKLYFMHYVFDYDVDMEELELLIGGLPEEKKEIVKQMILSED